ncbi:MAG: nuclear transport factor 2 family protein [Burkholderiaceae bacterium]|nr:nuclear transport factor 2 family protein [Burkholderiaceae bacterium]
MSNKRRFTEFLESYAKKDLVAIARLLADDATLKDWNISVRGREAVESETQKNFQDAESIKIEVLHLYEGQDSVAGELKITVNQSIEIYVVDVISFDSSGKIRAIRSYKGRED